MKKGTKIAMLAAAVLLVAGVALCGIGLWGVGFNWYALSTAEPGDYERKTAQYDAADFSAVRLEVNADDLRIVPSEDGQIHLQYTNRRSWGYEVTTKDGVLALVQAQTHRTWKPRDWFQFDLGVEDGDVELALPANFDGDLTLVGDVGDVEMRGIQMTGALDCTLQTGSFDAEALTADRVSVQNDVGEIDGEGWTVAQSLALYGQTGDISLEDVTVGGALISGIDVGDIILTRVSVRTADLTTQTGEIRLEALAADRLTATTDVGDVSGSLRGVQAEYTILTDAGVGESEFKDQKGTTDKEIQITTETGDIALKFCP